MKSLLGIGTLPTFGNLMAKTVRDYLKDHRKLFIEPIIVDDDVELVAWNEELTKPLFRIRLSTRDQAQIIGALSPLIFKKEQG